MIDLEKDPAGLATFRNGEKQLLYFSNGWAHKGGVAFRRESGWWIEYTASGENLEDGSGLYCGEPFDIVEWKPTPPPKASPGFCHHGWWNAG